MVLSAWRNHSESSMGRTCVIVVCVRTELYLNLETLIPATCALKHFYASGWWKNRHRLQLFYVRCLLLLCGTRKHCGKMNGRWRPDSRISHDALLFPLSHCQNLVSTPFTPYKIYLINVDQRTSCKLLSLFFSFCSAFFTEKLLHLFLAETPAGRPIKAEQLSKLLPADQR